MLRGIIFFVSIVITVTLNPKISNAIEPFSKERLRKHIQILASEAFEGRAPFSEGEKKTLDYIESEFKASNLTPLPGQLSFRLDVPLIQITAKVNGPIFFGDTQLQLGEDISVRTSSSLPSLQFEGIETVFVGYGIVSDQYNWNDYAGLDVKGKIVIVLVNDPGFTSPNLFQGKNMTYFGRWTYKLEEAQRQGALGAFVIHETEGAGYGWSVVGSQTTLMDLDVSGTENKSTKPLQVHGWLSEIAARRVLKDSGFDFDNLKAQAAVQPGTHGFLKASALKLGMTTTVKNDISQNICGMKKGTTLPDEYVMTSAHWDHLGKVTASDGTSKIFPGAIDNASGVAVLLELARYQDLNKITFQRSSVFCSFTAEEMILLGAKHFVENPPIPLHQIKGLLNFDAMNVEAENPNVALFGKDEGRLEAVLKKVAHKMNRNVIEDPTGEKGHFFRSDHYQFVKHGVPALLFMDIGLSCMDYLLHRYHQPTDVYFPTWSMDGMIQDLKLFHGLMTEIASCL